MGKTLMENDLGLLIQGMQDKIASLESQLRSSYVPIVTELPKNPYNDQTVDLLVPVTGPAANVLWRMRYNAASTNALYKWEYLGGPPAWKTTSTAQVITTITADATMVLTLPAVGIYDFSYLTAAFVNAANGYYEDYIGVNSATLGQVSQVLCPISGNNQFFGMPCEQRTITSVTDLTARLYCRPIGAATSMTLGYRMLTAIPQALG